MVIQNDALVAQINADGILGLDFMLANSCSVDVSHNVLLLKDKRIPLLVEDYIGCNRITSIKTVSIPPRAEILIVGQVLQDDNRIPTSTCLVEPFASGTPTEGFVTARTIVSPQETFAVRLLNVGEETKIIYQGTVIGQLSEVKVVASSEEDMTEQSRKLRPDLVEMLKKTANHLKRKQKIEAHTLLYEYTNLFAKSDSDLRRTDIVRHKIDTGTNPPVQIPPRRVPTHLTKEIDKHLDDMLERGVIEQSNSPWSAPVVLIKKKDGSYRFCIDYRKLNSNTFKDAYPLPRNDESLDQLIGSSWFSTLDLCSGYWQVEMEQEDKPKTAFATRRGLFQFSAMPFGLCCAPATFERLMETVLAGLH